MGFLIFHTYVHGRVQDHQQTVRKGKRKSSNVNTKFESIQFNHFRRRSKLYTHFDEVDYEQPPNLKEMKNLNRKGCELMRQLGYNEKGCGAREQGICVSIEPNRQETTSGLGYCPLKETKTSKNPSLNINTLTKYSSNTTLTLV